jgi:hypothetical protein
MGKWAASQAPSLDRVAYHFSIEAALPPSATLAGKPIHFYAAREWLGLENADPFPEKIGPRPEQIKCMQYML